MTAAPSKPSNPWDAGTAKLLASLGFEALATTSSGHAAMLGRPDGSIDRGEALAHASTIVAAVDVPVSADLENGFAEDPDAVFATVTDAVGFGLAGCSIEDFTGNSDTPIYEAKLAAERVAAAVDAARTGAGLVLTSCMPPAGVARISVGGASPSHRTRVSSQGGTPRCRPCRGPSGPTDEAVEGRAT